MIREGRGSEWDEVRARNWKMFRNSRATHRTMEEMGYQGAAKERELAAAYEEEQKTKEVAENPIKALLERGAGFDEAFQILPDQAPISVETDWIRSHPAMIRSDRGIKAERVLISAKDILGPPHGPAPSKAAVVRLQHFVNRQGDFFKQVSMETRKRQEETAKEEEEDPTVEEAYKILQEVLDGKKVAGGASGGT
jgi:hypothetical protein